MLDGSEAVKKRFTALDALRGFIIWHMVVFHSLYDINVIGGLNPLWPGLLHIALWQEIGLCIFVMLAGSSFQLMKAGKRWFHGLKINTMGLAITAITYIMIPEEAIFFGVLSFMGCVGDYAAGKQSLAAIKQSVCPYGFVSLYIALFHYHAYQ